MRFFFTLLLIFFMRVTVYSQNAEVNIQMKNATIENILKEIEKQTEYRFFYDAGLVKLGDAVDVSWSSKPVRDALTELFGGRGIDFRLVERQIVLYPVETARLYLDETTNTRRSLRRYTISGFMTDSLSSESLIGATVYNKTNMAGTSANRYGFYSLTLPESDVEIVYSYVGYNTQTLSFRLCSDTVVNISLAGGQHLQELKITASRASQIQETTQMSAVNLPVAHIKSLPALMGETDVMKALQLLPGIQSGGEGSTGLYVRGGGPDQNLILLDGVPVYNTSHFAGFLSVFNADAINNIEVIKGGFPARYGGRVSSVVDISMKEGNMQKFGGEGSMGTVITKFTFEGPIVKDRTSFIVSARRSLIDIMFLPLINNLANNYSEENRKTKFGYYFYDLNAKINHRFSDKDRIYLSVYMGSDKLGISESIKNKAPIDDGSSTIVWENNRTNVGIKWGNITSAFRWNHIFTNRLFGNTTITYSRYHFNTYSEIESTVTRNRETLAYDCSELRNISGIQDWSAKIAFDFVPSPNHYIRFGANAVYHDFNPSTVVKSDIDRDIGAHIYAWEYSAYAEDDIRLTKRLKTNIGLHWTAFESGGSILQPRISARYLITPQLSAKASYSRMAQYVHSLTSSSVGFSTDLWVPTTDLLRPQTSDQIAAGFAQNFRENYEISLEGYYKTMENVLEYRESVGFFDLDEEWDKKVVQGTGRSYGVELFIQKKTGTFTGWIGYTLSWTDRQFDELNSGKRFPYKYDRRHDISITAMKRFGKEKKHELSGVWVFGSGNCMTIPIGIYDVSHPILIDVNSGELNRYVDYGERNGYRMKPYHRLDLSVAFVKQNKWGERRWILGVYNAYSRSNPYYMDIESLDSLNRINWYNTRYKIMQVSLLPFMPSISYQFKF